MFEQTAPEDRSDTVPVEPFSRPSRAYDSVVTWRALEVADELAARVPEPGRLKLQKLLYFCQGHHLAQFGRPLFEEPLEAWDKGPVVRDVYNRDPETLNRSTVLSEEHAADEAALNTIGYVASQYGGMSGLNLMDLTHSQLPWLEARRTRVRNKELDLGSIEWYFRRSADEEDASSEPQVSQETIDQFVQQHGPEQGRVPRTGPDESAYLRRVLRACTQE